jgi:hypothetical protein
MALNRIQNRDLSWHTKEMHPLKPEDFPVTRNQKQIVKTTVKLPAEARTKKTAEDVAERLNAGKGRREEDRWSA